MPTTYAILTISKEPSEDDSTNKRFNLLSLSCYFSPVIILLYYSMSGEAEAGSAEEQPAKE